MSVYVNALECVHVYVCLLTSIVYMCTCDKYTDMCLYVYVCACMYVYVLCVQVFFYAYICTCVAIHTGDSGKPYMCISIYRRVYVCIFMCPSFPNFCPSLRLSALIPPVNLTFMNFPPEAAA